MTNPIEDIVKIVEQCERVTDDLDGVIRDLPSSVQKALSTKDVEPLGTNIIHSVTNPLPRLTGAIHIYGGDFFEKPRSEWDPETLLEGTYDVEKNMGLFEKSNRLLDLA